MILRSAAYVGELARHELDKAASAHGAGRLEVTREGASSRALGARTSLAGRRQNRTELGVRTVKTLRFFYARKTKG